VLVLIELTAALAIHPLFHPPKASNSPSGV
jgi:hypothetical protein